ncbi:MAG: hypothetical protein ACKVWV_19885 [Planctomycetota bacterium]
MIAWTAIALPTLLAAVLVFIASSLIHMVIQWHKPDYRGLSNEDEVRAALRKGSASPGQYIVPHCKSPKEMAEPAMVKKLEEGPVATLYVRPNGVTKLGSFLGMWFAYTIVVGLLVGTLARSVLPHDAPYMHVFHLVAGAAWLAYAWQGPQESIWKGVPWISTLRYMIDGLVYALLTAGAFAWLWPR